jgi:hypothetical protein
LVERRVNAMAIGICKFCAKPKISFFYEKKLTTTERSSKKIFCKILWNIVEVPDEICPTLFFNS